MHLDVCASKIGFTLAEVLITLGIIGIVAALTLPTLIQNYQKKATATKLAKVYSVMNQAIKMSSAVNGEPKDWVKNCGISYTPTCTTEEVKVWFNEYLGKYLNVTDTKVSADDKKLLVYLNDGVVLGISQHIYDIDVYLNPNKIDNSQSGKDCFRFKFMSDKNLNPENIDSNKYLNAGMFEPDVYKWDGTRESLLISGDGTYGCKDGSKRTYCAKLIQYDGWEISPDYPW